MSKTILFIKLWGNININTRNQIHKPFIIFYFLCISFSVKAQSYTILIPLSDSGIFTPNIFDNEAPIACTLKLNLKKLQKDKNTPKYIKANFIYTNSSGAVTNKKVRIKARGTVRNKICAIPPVWMQTCKLKQEGKIYKKDRYKVVTHCNQQANFDEYILKEYLVYKLYQLLSPNSFKVKLLKITYIDTGRKNKQSTRWAFIIEPLKYVTNRTGTIEIKLDELGVKYTSKQSTDLMCMFAYLMGNTDWSIPGRHNIKLIQSTNFRKSGVIPVPYDFDYAGFVNTPYAIPSEGTGLNNVRERTFIGPCREAKEYIETIEFFLSKQDLMLKEINSFPYLSTKSKNELITYLNSCFENMRKEDFIKYYIDIDCLDVSENE